MGASDSEASRDMDRVEGMQVCTNNSDSGDGLDPLVSSGLANGTIKRCPWCRGLCELMSGCNFVTCACGPDHHWCFMCGLKKGPAPNCPYGHPSHNSH